MDMRQIIRYVQPTGLPARPSPPRPPSATAYKTAVDRSFAKTLTPLQHVAFDLDLVAQHDTSTITQATGVVSCPIVIDKEHCTQLPVFDISPRSKYTSWSFTTWFESELFGFQNFFLFGNLCLQQVHMFLVPHYKFVTSRLSTYIAESSCVINRKHVAVLWKVWNMWKYWQCWLEVVCFCCLSAQMVLKGA